ncbi:MAG: HNH endonuclease [Chloroflexi bacterium]|nr:HNH endonuclease [Chloroflexota bacterium]
MSNFLLITDDTDKLYADMAAAVERLRSELRHARKLHYLAFFAALHGPDCAWCGEPLGTLDPVALHLDHIIPRSHGGGDDCDNRQLLHAACNLAKGQRPMSDAPVGRLTRIGERLRPQIDAAAKSGEPLVLDASTVKELAR